MRINSGTKVNSETEDKIRQCNIIIREYMGRGLTLAAARTAEGGGL